MWHIVEHAVQVLLISVLAADLPEATRRGVFVPPLSRGRVMR